VTSREAEALELFADACGITREIARQLHLSYLEEMTRIANTDGVVTEDERRHLRGLISLLSAALPR
jgi:uncharacterized tellurite resistance protein B-like protein